MLDGRFMLLSSESFMNMGKQGLHEASGTKLLSTQCSSFPHMQFPLLVQDDYWTLAITSVFQEAE